MHPVLARVLAARGLRRAEDAALKLEDLHPPEQLRGADAAAALLADAVAANQPILAVGDFDADGATGSALALSLLRAMGAKEAEYLVPNRFEFGYGLSPEIVRIAAARKPAIIMTVDNGISSLEGVALARELGIKTLVTDHHLPGAALPEADVIVNPNQPGCDFPSKSIAGVGVVFYVMLALRAELRRRGWFGPARPEPKLSSGLDLVALGTVADVVPLDGNNRILVQQGLQRMRAGHCRPGIRALLEAGGRELNRVTAEDLAFAAAPRLNAAGRLSDMSAGIECLLAADAAKAQSIAAELDNLNHDRRAIEQSMQREAETLLDAALETVAGAAGARERGSPPTGKDGLPPSEKTAPPFENAASPSEQGAPPPAQDGLPPAVCLYHPEWHQGVVGLLASRIKDRLHRPVIAFARGDDGILKGSARSIPGLHIRDALARVDSRAPDLIDKFGGHAMAAGLSLAAERLPEFQAAFTETAAEFLQGADLEPALATDGELAPEDFNLALARQLRYAAPWGQHFPAPLFDGVFELVTQRIVGGSHLKLVLRPPAAPGCLLDAIAFNVDTDRWAAPALAKVRLAYRLDCNYFRGEERLQLAVEQIEPA